MFPIGAMSIALAGLVDGEPTPERILREAARLGLDGVEFYESDWGGAPGDLEEAALASPRPPPPPGCGSSPSGRRPASGTTTGARQRPWRRSGGRST